MRPNATLGRLLTLLLLLAFFAQGMAHIRHASITFDEGPHLATGYATLRTGDLRLQPVHIHPPLANVLAAAPLLLQDDLPDPRQIDGWEIASLSAVTDTVVWQYPHPARLAVAGRLPILWLGLLLGALLLRWARELGGRRAGLLALALCAFDPNVIAHGTLITTDMAATLLMVATLYVANRQINKPATSQGGETGRQELWGWAGVGVLLGLAQLAKVSALMLIPIVGVMFLVAGRRSGAKDWIRKGLGLLIPAGLVLWAGYGFEVGWIPGFPLPLPAATHARIYLSLREHYELGHATFLLRRVSSHGWWWYFPVAFLLKTPLPVLILSALALVYGVSSVLRQKRASLILALHSRLPLLLFPLLYAASTLFSTVNIGYRHLLPLLPFLYLGIGVAGNDSLALERPSRRDGPTYFLVVWLALGTLIIAPDYLAFFNLLAGGPAGGYRHLVDSNLDWGQNLWELRAWLEAESVDHVYYAHYSPARPAVYGIEADFLPPDPRAVAFTPWEPTPGVYALGATVLQGPYAPDINTYAWFRSRDPEARLGHALFVYRVEARAPYGYVAVCASPLPTLEPQVIQQAAGDATLRVIRYDCTESTVYAPDLPGAYTLYRLASAPPPPLATRRAESEGPFAFLGYELEQTEATAGETLTLRTHWRVEAVPPRPLSLMAHPVGADGVPIAVGDGLGVPLDQLQPGDVVVQQHPFTIPEETPPGSYAINIGAYWLESLERWTWQTPGGETPDQVTLLSIQVSAAR